MIEKKIGLFYELMIRGNWDPQAGELGSIVTYQLQTGSAVVDTDTNMLVAPYAPDPAVDLTKEQAAAFLDEKMAGFLDQLAVERANTAQHAADLVVAQQQAQAADQARATAEAAAIELKRLLDVATARIAAVQGALGNG